MLAMRDFVFANDRIYVLNRLQFYCSTNFNYFSEKRFTAKIIVIRILYKDLCIHISKRISG